MEQLVGALVLMYEPRRGGTSPDSKGGGRSAFTGLAYVDHLTNDPDEKDHAFAWLRYTLDFNVPVPVRATAISGNALQTAVLQIDYEEASRIVAIGLSVPHSEGGAESRVGLSDLSDLTDVTARPIEQVLQSRRVRDASFHYRVVEKAYQGRCAFTGVRMTNGHGRAEADAAHIRPVAADGPDTVRNGLALMKSLHWAFDRGLVALADDGRILTVERGLEEPVRHLLAADGRAILPRHADERPHPAFLRWHREHVFKGAA